MGDAFGWLIALYSQITCLEECRNVFLDTGTKACTGLDGWTTRHRRCLRFLLEGDSDPAQRGRHSLWVRHFVNGHDLRQEDGVV